MTGARRAGTLLLLVIALCAAGAPALSPHHPDRQFANYEQAPPMWPRVVHPDGGLTRPFVYPIALADRLERRYEEDRGRPMRIRWFADGVLASVDEKAGPWLPLGADPLGRDVLARLLYGARLSLALALAASLGALAIGVLVGGTAGYLGGRVETVLMAIADFVLILPAIYVVLAFRAALPLVLTATQVFWALTVVMMLAGWPLAARGVRAIVSAERRREYAEAAHALGASRWRILLRHLLPATTPFLALTWTMMVPAFVVAESTLSLVGLGFPVPSATWGTMMRDAWQGGAFADAPWLMAPAVAMVLTVFSLHLLGPGRPSRAPGTGTFS